MLNGSPYGLFTPQHGLKQVDPLSPFLFILAAEVLMRLLNRAEAQGLLHGIKVARHAPSVSHLMFADDLLVFFHANGREATEIQNILCRNAKWSGQLINHSKFVVYCSPNTHIEVVASIRNILKLKIMSSSSKYLGLPLFLGR